MATPPAERSRAIESAAAALSEDELAQWQANFDSLPVREQMRLAREAAQARGVEYVRAWRNVIGVTSGFRRRRGDGDHEFVHPEPCVVFVVRRKWRGGAAPARSPALPRWLLAHADLPDGRRALCAIPTDVQAQRRFLRMKPQGDSAVRVRDGGASFTGTLTLAARDAAGTLYALSAAHVLTPEPQLDGRGLREGATAALAGHGATPVARATAIGGGLRPAEQGPSFDVQLARALDPAALRAALADLRLDPERPLVEGIDELAELNARGNLLVLVPDNHPKFAAGSRLPIPAALSTGGLANLPLDYDFAGPGGLLRRRAAHDGLVELQLLAGQRTAPGDSGSPVVVLVDGRMHLAGMHIAGDTAGGATLMIPAWQLLDRLAYEQEPAGALQLVLPA